MTDERHNRFRGCLLGLAVGDAVGTTVEFQSRGSFPDVTDMVGGGPFDLEPGQWTDDTSLALCLAESLIEKHGFDPTDQAERYVHWFRDGHLSSTGQCFDIGITTRNALVHFEETGEAYAGATHPRSAGNGSIMRLAPVPMFYADDMKATVHYAGESSRITHGALECVDACRLYATMQARALNGADKKDILAGKHGDTGALCTNIQTIADGHYATKDRDDIRGSGYVVDSLEAALWCFQRTSTFRDAILASVNLGDDTDTTAAICGQIAGAYYGASGIPADWLDTLCMRDRIISFADALCATGQNR